jgi:hypothetical protein
LRTDVADLVRALVRLSTYTADLEHLSADAAIAQLQIAAKSGVLYLDGGWRQLIDGLRARTAVQSNVSVQLVEPSGNGVEVHTADGGMTAGAVIIATGGPAAAAKLLAEPPEMWTEVGPAVTAACLDVGVARIPQPGYVVGVDAPIYATTQGPPALQAPAGSAVVGAIRYGARSAAEDRPELEAHLRVAGVADDDIVTSRFLAHMVVASAMPTPATGGLRGRPPMRVESAPGVFVAGDWVGAAGLLADASLGSGHAAARLAARAVDRPTMMVP